jgi:hypothetical protein
MSDHPSRTDERLAMSELELGLPREFPARVHPSAADERAPIDEATRDPEDATVFSLVEPEDVPPPDEDPVGGPTRRPRAMTSLRR